ncbi:MAG: cation:proton antiporter [Hyphomicrobiales bacterium]|nr:cation:proton antiporter [Hyphomicrobiales bacterium]MBV9977156.1 cation:proton antiporter [Hyphomicrobiales bacterium]
MGSRRARRDAGEDGRLVGHRLSPLRVIFASVLGALAFAPLSIGPALAAGAENSAAPSDAIFIAEIVILLIVGRGLGELMHRVGQPAIIGQLLAGILVGNSVLGSLWPSAGKLLFPHNDAQHSMIDGVGQLGVLMLLLLTGMETDLELVSKVKRAAASVSITGIAVPFTFGFLTGEYLLPDSLLPTPERRLVTALFLGTALSISSIKIVAMVVREMNFMRRDLGQVIIASAIIEDSIGWIVIAITFSLATQGKVDAGSLARSVGGTALFLIASLTLGRPVVHALIRWANDRLVSELPVITVILAIMGIMALVTHLIGVHTVLGAFVAGVLIGESPILTRHIEGELRGLITALFMPIFFALAGLNTDITILSDPHLLLMAIGIILIASVGKFGGAFLGGEIGGLTKRESLALGIAMNARGSTEVIIASIGLSIGALNSDLYTIIVAMAVVTTMAMPPTLRWALGRLPIRAEEKQRLEREEFEANGFVANIERILLTVDDSPSGRLAGRLAGLVAGPRGLPTTTLHVEGKSLVGAGPEAATALLGPGAANTPAPKAAVPPPDQAVASEARKGYDLLTVGLQPARAAAGGFHSKIVEVARSFEGTVGVVVARGALHERPLRSRLNILVPVNGSNASRRAAEFAFALARIENVVATVVYVAPAERRPGESRRLGRSLLSRRHEDAILKDITTLADQYGIAIRTVVRVADAAPDAILRQARRAGHTLIVVGATKRQSDTLIFGMLANELLERAEQSVLFLGS